MTLAGFLAFVKRLLKARKGRPVAMAALFGLLVVNLLSEWPSHLSQNPALTAFVQAIPTPFQTARQTLFDQYQRRSPRKVQTQPVTIVAIDERSLAAMGQWPWPRNKLAALIDAITVQQPLAIGLDIYMPEPDQTSPDKVAENLPPNQSRLAQALRTLPSHETVLAQSLEASPSILGAAAFDHAAYTTSTDLRTLPIVSATDAIPFVKRFDHVLASLPQLQNAAKGQALLSVALDQGVVRRIPLVLGLGTKLVPGLAMEMLRVATGSGGVEVNADGYGVQSVGVADVTVPTQPNGEIWLHFAHLSATQDRYVSAIDVLQGKVATERLENKLVLLGLTGAGLNDMRTTALGELVPGIEIQAQVIETIFDGRFLQRPAWLKWAESGFILLFGLLMIWYLPKTDTRMAVFVKAVPMSSALLGFLLNLLIVLSGFFFFNRFGLLVDAVSIFIILSTVLASLVSSAITEIDQLAKDKEAQAHRARESSAYESGMQAGRRQQGPSEVPDSGVPGVGTQA